MDTNIIRPFSSGDLLKVGSKQILEKFLSSGLSEAIIECANTNREPNSVYTAMLLYLNRHPNVDVGAKLSDGKVVLYRKAMERPQSAGPQDPGVHQR